MADNVAITAGSGTSIAADDIGSVFYQRVKVGLGADGTAVDAVGGAGVVGTGVQRVTIANDDYLLCSLAPTQATFAIANAAYASGDCVSTAQTFTTVGASGKQVMIVGATLSIDHTTAIASSFRLHMFNAAKATPLADNDPHTVLSADLAKYLGYIDLGTPVDLGTICWVAQNGLAIPVKLSTANIVAQLEIITGLTPAASNLQVTLFTVPMS